MLDANPHAGASGGIRAAFAKFGMGSGARSNGASLAGIEASFQTGFGP